MLAQIDTDEREATKIYRAAAVWKNGALAILLPLLFALTLIPCLRLLSTYQRTGNIQLSGFILPIIVASICLLVLRRARRTAGAIVLTLSPSGLAYHSPQLVIETTWENVQALSDDPLAPALWLKQAAATHRSPFLQRDLASGRCIPLSAFNYSRSSALAQDLRQYAPHLFLAARRA